MNNNIDAFIILPHLQVQNANAISGPLTWGFPSPSAFTGFVHALNRKVGKKLGITLDGVGIICHDFSPQITWSKTAYANIFCLQRHPLTKDGKTASFVEDGRAFLEVTLLIGVTGGYDEEEGAHIAAQVLDVAQNMRLAGGSILPGKGQKKEKPLWIPLPEYADERQLTYRQVRRSLLPGFALVSRGDLLQGKVHALRENGNKEATALDALLDFASIHYVPVPEEGDNPQSVTWNIRSKSGWLVPLPVGYGAISPVYAPGTVLCARDQQTPFRFAEAVYSLGEWVSPHRISDPLQLLWFHAANPDAGLYLCVNNYTSSITTCEE